MTDDCVGKPEDDVVVLFGNDAAEGFLETDKRDVYHHDEKGNHVEDTEGTNCYILMSNRWKKECQQLSSFNRVFTSY